MDTETVRYFAYGSNADPARFEARVGPWRARRAAWLPDHRLRFAAAARSEGGGGAVVDPAPGEEVAGVLYEITPAQLAAMDAVELDPTRDTQGLGRRETVTLRTADGPLEAELYTLADDGATCAPSERYLGHILTGLASVGHEERELERVRRAAVSA